MFRGLSGSAAHEVQDEDYQCNHEQQVYDPAADVKSEPTAPKNQEKNGNN
jgi:hypothetical protein